MTYDTINDAVTTRGESGPAIGRIDKYELVRELGEGGFGAVYLAHDTVADTDVAIKGLPPEVKHNAVELESIQQNFALVKRLRHPNIVAVTDLHQALSVSYASKEAESKLRVFERDTMVVMDYAPGVTLAKWRKRFDGGTVPLDSAIAVVRQVASALDFAHARKVLHRDVKPANVIVEEVPTGGGLTARVLDFGLAAEIRSSMGRVSREIRDTSGTRPYMAPEQWLGEKQGPATDQYSLAVLFFELVTGAVPFASVFDCGDTAVMRLAVTTDAPKIPADLPKKVRRALATALAKKPEERFASCAEFVDALEGKSVASSGGAGKVFGVFALLAVLASGGYYGWMKYGKGVESRDAGPERVAATNQPPEVIVQPPSEEPPKPPSEPPVDKEFVKLTNDLAVAVAARKKTYDAAATYRHSPRGFADRLKMIDETWGNRQSVKPALSKQEAEEAIKIVKNEMSELAECVKWMADRKNARDDAEKREVAFDAKLAGWRKNEADLFARAERRNDWSNVQKMIGTARESIDKGDFDKSGKLFDSTEKYIGDVLLEERANKNKEKEESQRIDDELKAKEDERKKQEDARKKQEDADRKKQEAEKETRAAKTKAFMARLAREGFVLDSAANRHAMGSEKRISIGSDDEIVMVWCPPGWFMMGSPKSEMGRNEGETRHPVHLSKGFWIGKYEVTQRQWAAVMGGSVWWGKDKPKSSVTWNECKNFIRRFNKQTGLSIRLPTEAEWEYACRAGTSTPFSFGSVLNGMQACCNGGDPYGTDARGPANISGPSDVGSFATYSNAWGINDMHGNVYEWCEDSYDEYPKTAGIAEDPVNEGNGEVRVIRGGCWNYSPRQCRSAFRTPSNPDWGTAMIGFRLACDDLP